MSELTRTVELGGLVVDGIPLHMSDSDVAALLIQSGQLSSAEQAFPRADIPAAVAAAQREAASQFNPLERFSIGLRGKVADMALTLEDLTGLPGRGEEIRQEQATRAELERAGVDLGVGGFLGELVPNLALGRLKRFFPVVGAEAAVEGLAGEEGGRIRSAAEGAAGAAVGFGLGKVASAAIDSGVSSARNLIARAESARGARAAPDVVVDMSEQILEEGQRVRPAISFDERLANLGVDDVTIAPSVSQQARRFELVRELDRIGFPLSPGQRSGNAARRQLEAGLASAVTTAQPWAELAEQQAISTGRLLARGIGENADAITPEVLDNAYARLGGEFREIATELGNDVFQRGDFAKFANSLELARWQELSDIRFYGLLDDLPAGKIIQNMIDAAGDGVDGRQLMAWRSSLTDEIQQLTSGRVTSARGSTVFALSDAVDAIDELIVGATRGTELAGRYADARTQYRLLSAIGKTRAIDQLGDIRPRSLANVLSQEYPLEFRRGQLTGFHPDRSAALQSVADAFDAVRGLATIAPDIVANSGTPTRMFVQNLAMSDITPNGLTQLAVRASLGNSVSEAAMGAPSVGAGSEAVRRLVPRTGAALGAAQSEGLLDAMLEAGLQLAPRDDDRRE